MKFELDQIEKALPKGFEFYDYGTVERGETLSFEDIEFEGKTSYLFRLVGFELGQNYSLIICFHQDLERSKYIEIGNLVASKVATVMSQKQREFFISPPREIPLKRVSKLDPTQYNMRIQQYLHSNENRQVPLEIIVIHNETKEEAHHV